MSESSNDHIKANFDYQRQHNLIYYRINKEKVRTLKITLSKQQKY